jgi:hypothetical protein
MVTALQNAGLFVLEPYAAKVSCTVFRGRGGGNTTLLPDILPPKFENQKSTIRFPNFARVS